MNGSGKYGQSENLAEGQLYRQIWIIIHLGIRVRVGVMVE